MLHEETKTDVSSKDSGSKKVRKPRNVHTLPPEEDAALFRNLKILEGCSNCSYHINCTHNNVDGYGGNPCKVLIVFDWAHQHKPYSIPGLLRQAISNAKIPHNYIRYTSAIRCVNVPNFADHTDNVKRCRENLLAEIAEHKPKVVITIGESAHSSLCGKGAENLHNIVKDDRGFFRINVVPTLTGALNSKLRLELFSVFKKVNNLIQDITFPPDAKYVIVETERQLELAEKLLLKAPELVFDFETGTDLDRKANSFEAGDTVLCCGFSWGEDRAIVIPLDHKDNPLPKDKCFDVVRKVLTSDIPKIAHNAIYDQFAFYHFFNGYEVNNLTFDTMLAHHLLDPTQGTHSLKYLTSIYTPYGGYEEALKDLFLGPDGKRSYGNVPLQPLAQYCAVDVDMTYRLKQRFAPQIKENPKLDRLFRKLTMPTSEVFYDIRKEGMYVNKDKLADIREYYTEKLQKATKSLYENPLVIAHAPTLNIASPKQLQHLLFDVLKLRVVKTTDKGSPSTDEEAVNRLAAIYKSDQGILDLLEAIIQIRKANKYLSTYVEGLSTHIDKDRIYTTYLLHGTTSGRPSSINPNLLNIPSEDSKDTPLDRHIKSIFEAPKDYIFCSADFSQIELRNIGNETLEPELVDAYLQNMDMHTKTASLIFGVDMGGVESYQRKIGKTTNFGGAYGAGPATLASQIESQGSLSDEELILALQSVGIYTRKTPETMTADDRNDLLIKLAKYIQQTLFQQWATFGAWQRKQRSFAEQEARVYSRFGRCRYLHFPPNATNSQKWKLINTAVNYPIQSVSSDCLMLAMIRIAKEFKMRKLKSRVVGQVYDSINYYVHKDEKDFVLSLIKTVMELEPRQYDPEYFTIPMEVDIAIGPNWADLKKVENIKYIKELGLYGN